MISPWGEPVLPLVLILAIGHSSPGIDPGHELDVGSKYAVKRLGQLVTTPPPALHPGQPQIGASAERGRVEGLVGDGIPPSIQII